MKCSSRSEAIARLRADDGFVGGAEAMLFGVVVFVFGILLVFNAWAVVDAKMAVSAAARETTRTLVESDGDVDAAVAAGHAAFVAGTGLDPAGLSAPELSGELSRCSRVRVSYSYEVPAISLPGGFGWGRGFEVTASHSEIVDPFRSGLDGEAVCTP